MAKSKKEKERVVTIDDIDYKFNDMTDESKMWVNHVADLDNKINHGKFNLDQLMVGRDACMLKLNSSLNPVEAEVVED